MNKSSGLYYFWKVRRGISKQFDSKFNFNFSMTFVRVLSELASLERRAQPWIIRVGWLRKQVYWYLEREARVELLWKIKRLGEGADQVLLQLTSNHWGFRDIRPPLPVENSCIIFTPGSLTINSLLWYIIYCVLTIK